MIPDWDTNCVFVSALLPARHPLLWEELVRALDQNHVEHHLLQATRDIWVRDFMPVQVAAGHFVLFRYQPDYLLGDEGLITPEDARRAIPHHDDLRASRINLDGGNLVAALKRVVLTDKVYKENPEFGRPALREELAAVLQAECLVVPKEPYDVIGHADGVVRFLDEDRVVVNDYRDIDPGYGERLETALCRQGLVVEHLPHFRVEEEHDGIPSAAGNYVNYLRVGRLVIVPAYGVTQDDLACKTLERLLPEARVVPLRCEGLAREGGVFNCVTWTICASSKGSEQESVDPLSGTGEKSHVTA
jgi:agmatine deiminase